jgi:hypothetical protein
MESPGYWEETTGRVIQGNYILMFANGDIPLCSDGEYIKLLWTNYDGHDSIVSSGGVVITIKNEKLGLYDVIKQREILPPVYDSIAPFELIFYAVKDGHGFLYDKNGSRLYSLGELTEEQLLYTFQFHTHVNDIYEFNANNINRWGIDAEYYFNTQERLFYRIADNASGIERDFVGGAISAWGDYIIIATEGLQSVYVTDRNGNVLYFGECHRYIVSGEYLVLLTASGFVLVAKDFNERKFPVELTPNDMFRSGSHFHEFDGELVFFLKEFWDEELYSVDEAGNVLKVGEFDRFGTQDGPVYLEDNAWYLRDADGNALLRYPNVNEEYGLFVHLWRSGDFVILSVFCEEGGSMSACPRKVYSLAGELLLENIYGIADSSAPGGGIFVYTTPYNCIVLYPDGGTISVSAAPVVEKVDR